MKHSEKNSIIASIKKLKTIFEILPSGIDANTCILVCEINSECFSFCIKDVSKNMILAVGVYNFDMIEGVEDFYVLDDFLSKKILPAGTFRKVCILYSYAESVLIPFSLYNSAENDNVLNLIHGDLTENTITLTDLITDKEAYNTYRVPVPILRTISSKFPNAETTHQYSYLLRQAATETNKLFVIFYSKKIIVRLIKNGKTVLINNYYYNSPEDVSYNLLNTCRQYEVTNVPLEVSGLIEKDSILFKEIYKYFEPVSFATLPDSYNYSENILQYPPHYFSHIFAIDSCE